ncbi:MAG: LysR substrate-binding domain-containing protein [Alphaproteobacteria bacterium]|nr:LysR substrate-binding domain-containing protein [Alphaproteobacteria bacterium]
MDLKQLESFVRVAELGSFTRAAIALGVQQPLLSRHVRQLEVELRQNLLDRNGRGVTLTEAGRVLLEHARGILHQVEVAREDLGAVRGALGGRVSIGLPPSLSRLITVPLCQAFKQKLPGAQLTLTEGFSLQMYEALRSGRLDMAVLYNPTISPELETSSLHEESLMLIGSPAAMRQHALKAKTELTLQQVSALPLILPSQPNAFRLLIESEMLNAQLRPRVVLEVDGLNAILELVREGLGFAVLPPYTLSSHVPSNDFSLHRITRPKLMSQLRLVWSARRQLTPTHQAAIAITQERVSDALRGFIQEMKGW